MTTSEATPLVICKYCSNDQVRTCIRCESLFCVLHAAKFSPNFCKDCLTNLTSILDRFERTTTEYDPISDTLETHTQSCDRIHIDGAAWVFVKAWLDLLNDDELKVVYEFHYFVLKLIEHDNEVRQVKKAKKLASAPTPMGIVTTKETKTRKVAEPKDMQRELEKLGIAVTTIKMMLAAAGIPYKEPTVTGGNNGNVRS